MDAEPVGIPRRVIVYGATLARRTGLDTEDGISFAAEAWGLREKDDEALWRVTAYRNCIDEARRTTGRATNGGARPRSKPELILDAPIADARASTIGEATMAREDPAYQEFEDRADLVAVIGRLGDADLAALARSFWLRIPQEKNSPGAVAVARAMRRARVAAAAPVTSVTSVTPVTPVGPAEPTASGAAPPDASARLTRRQAEILALTADGMTNEQIASHLTISTNTVKTTVANALRALRAESRTHAVAIALRAGLIS